MDTKKILALVHKNINIPGLLGDVIDQILEPALKKVVESSENKLDDIAMAAIYPVLEKELKEQIQKLFDKMTAEQVAA